VGARAPEAPGYATRGQGVLTAKQCVRCHAASVWKHAPRMAEEARRMGVPYPRFTGEQMGNLVGLLRSTAKAP